MSSEQTSRPANAVSYSTAFLHAILWVLCFALQFASAEGSDGGAELSRQKAYYVAAITAELERLTTGDYLIEGRVSQSKINGGAPEPITYHEAFEIDKGLRIIDETIPVAFHAGGKTGTDGRDFVIARFIMVRRPDVVMHWVSSPFGPESLQLSPPTYSPPMLTLFWNADVTRVVYDSAAAWLQIRAGPHSVRSTLEAFNLDSADKLADGKMVETKWSVRVSNGKVLRQWTLLLDSTRRYVPIRVEVGQFLLLPNGQRAPMYSSTDDIGWTEINDLYVPISVMSSDSTGSKYDLQISWKSVNAPLPKDAFERKRLTLDGGTYVIDNRGPGGKPVMLGLLGGDMPMREPVLRNPPPVPSSRRFWIIAANVALVAILLALVYWRRRVARLA